MWSCCVSPTATQPAKPLFCSNKILNHSTLYKWNEHFKINEMSIFFFFVGTSFLIHATARRWGWTCGTGNEQYTFSRQNIKRFGSKKFSIDKIRLECLLHPLLSMRDGLCQGAYVGTLDKQSERNSSYSSPMKSNCYCLFITDDRMDGACWSGHSLFLDKTTVWKWFLLDGLWIQSVHLVNPNCNHSYYKLIYCMLGHTNNQKPTIDHCWNDKLDQKNWGK